MPDLEKVTITQSVIGDTKTPQVPAGDTFWLAWINFLGLVTHIIIRDEKIKGICTCFHHIYTIKCLVHFCAWFLCFGTKLCRESRCFLVKFLSWITLFWWHISTLKKVACDTKSFFAGLDGGLRKDCWDQGDCGKKIYVDIFAPGRQALYCSIACYIHIVILPLVL